jgi:plasmid stabilization system protein ParE
VSSDTPSLVVELHVEAEHELREAFLWYFERDAGTAGRFEVAVERALAALAEAPLQSPEIEPGRRRLLIDRFPYALIYAVEGRRIVVLAVAHSRRRPGYWHGR